MSARADIGRRQAPGRSDPPRGVPLPGPKRRLVSGAHAPGSWDFLRTIAAIILPLCGDPLHLGQSCENVRKSGTSYGEGCFQDCSKQPANPRQQKSSQEACRDARSRSLLAALARYGGVSCTRALWPGMPLRSSSASSSILVVEDEPLVLMLTESIFMEAGYQTLTASDVDEAVTVLRSNAVIDLLFTDIGLRRATDGGLTLAREAVQLRPSIHVVYASARPLTRGLRTKLVDGSRFLPKPYGRGQVLAAVTNGASP
jgi:CheY-like chemotaxis protein